jgi:hypothetical protein
LTVAALTAVVDGGLAAAVIQTDNLQVTSVPIAFAAHKVRRLGPLPHGAHGRMAQLTRRNSRPKSSVE